MTDKTKGAPARSALKLALEALECDPLDMALNPDGHMGFRKDQAITAIREALAEPSEALAEESAHESELLMNDENYRRKTLALVNKVDQEESSGTEQPAQKEYTSFSEWAHDYVQDNLHKLKPAQRKPWMSLTDDEAIFLIENELLGRGDLIDAIEAKLKAKNSP